MKQGIKMFFKKASAAEVDGIGVIEIILILVIVIGLVLIFRNQITDIVQNAFNSINGNAEGINKEMIID